MSGGIEFISVDDYFASSEVAGRVDALLAELYGDGDVADSVFRIVVGERSVWVWR